MKWGQAQFLWLLAAVPVLIAIVVYTQARSRKAWAKVTDAVVWPQAFAERSRARTIVAQVFWIAGLALAFIAVARPQYGASTVKQTRRGLDLVVALDTSKSMLAKDLAPDRISRAKLELSSLLDQLQGDRVGLIAFAGDAFVQCPLTSDYGAAKVFLRALDTNTIPRGGTAIGSAINAADKLLSEARERGGAKSQILIIITDGEDHDEGALPAAKALAEKGVTIFTVGVGSAAGEPIPMNDDKGRFIGYMKDRQGSTVLTRLNEDILKQLADAGHGRYVASGGGTAGIEQLIPDLAGFEREEHEAKFKVVYTDRFQWALVPGIVLLMIGLFLPRRRRRLPMTVVFFALFGAGRAEAGVPLLTGKNSDVESANKQLAANKPDEAIKGYEAAQKELGQRAELYINQGLALEKKGDHKGAKPMLERALMSNDAATRSKAHYLIGNGAFDDKDYQGAIEEFKKALRELPRNQDAKYNLELSQKMLKEQQEQQKKDQKNDKKDDKQKQEQKDKKDQKDQKQDDKKDQGDKDKKDEQKPDEKKQDQKDPQKDQQPKPGEQQPQPQQAKPESSEKEKQRDQLLDALKSEEKALRYNVFQTPKQRKSQAVEKDW